MMLKKVLVILGVVILLLYGYSYTEVGFTISTIKERDILQSINDPNQLIVSDDDKGLFVAIYGDKSHLTVYEFAQNPLTKRYSLITQSDITLISGVFGTRTKTSINEIEYDAELENQQIVFKSSKIREDVIVRVVWDVVVVVLIIGFSLHNKHQKQKV